MKLVKYFIIIILSIIFLMGGIGIIISNFYGKKVTTYVLNELEKQIGVDIEFSSVKFSVIKKFPNASVEIHDLNIKPNGSQNLSSSGPACLLCAKSVFFELNLAGIIRKKYVLQTIDITKGNINVYFNKGHTGFDFLAKGKSSQTSPVWIHLQKIILKNCRVLYINNDEKIKINTEIKKLKAKGSLSGKNFFTQVTASLFINEFISGTLRVIDSKNIDLTVELNRRNDVLSVKKGCLTIENNRLRFSGNVDNREKNYTINVESPSFQITTLEKIIPPVYLKNISDYTGTGKLAFNGMLTGNAYYQNPHLEASFTLEKGMISNKKNKLAFNNINIDAEFSNGKLNTLSSSFLNVKTVDFYIGKTRLKGNFELFDLTNPHFKINVTSDAYLSELQDVFAVDTIQTINGKIISCLELTGAYKNLKNIRLENKYGTILLEGINFQLKGHPFEYSGINGKLRLDNDVFIDSLSFFINKNDVAVKGKLYNLFNYITSKTELLTVEGVVKSKKVSIPDLLNIAPPGGKKNPALTLPERLQGSLDFYIQNLLFKKFSAEKISGSLTYQPGQLLFKNLHFYSMDGEIRGETGLTKASGNLYMLGSKNELKNIDIQKLFYSFGNFGQTVLQDRHLKGFLSGNVLFSANLSEFLDIDEESVHANSSVEIINGELINFKPVNQLSKFIKLSELEHITFKSIKNQISIQNKIIIIPYMDINTSAFNISGSGEQHFRGNFEYKIKVNLSELLSNKAKKEKKENEEFGIVEDDGLGKINLHLSIQGTPENYTIKYDKKSAKNERKQKFADEKTELKTILYEELGLFKKDSATLKSKKPVPKKIIVEWDETEEEENEGESIQGQNKRLKKDTGEQKFIIEWDEK